MTRTFMHSLLRAGKRLLLTGVVEGRREHEAGGR